jgi:hypothetical protein
MKRLKDGLGVPVAGAAKVLSEYAAVSAWGLLNAAVVAIVARPADLVTRPLGAEVHGAEAEVRVAGAESFRVRPCP